jgi:hypothetical protein
MIMNRAKHLLRSHVSKYPALYLPFARHKYPGPSPEVIAPWTELVIDGYTRSATTFAVYALQLSQGRPIRLAHHLHAPAQLILAARRGIPTLALIRKPQGAIFSQLVCEPTLKLRDALAAYSRFYSCLLPYRDRFVVGEFDEVTRDFGSVVRRLNARFDTSFVEFDHTEANERACWEFIKYRGTLSATLLGFESGTATMDELNRELGILIRRSEVLDTREVWMPSTARERSESQIAEQWTRSELDGLRERAELAYRAFLE